LSTEGEENQDADRQSQRRHYGCDSDRGRSSREIRAIFEVGFIHALVLQDLIRRTQRIYQILWLKPYFGPFLSYAGCTLVYMRRGELLTPLVPNRWLEADDLEGTSVDDLGAFLVGIESEVSRLEQQRSLVLAEFDVRDGHEAFGFPNSVDFLKSACAMSSGRARRLVKNARAARKHTATFSAWRFGHLSTDQAEQLFDISHQLPDKYDSGEQVLIDIAGSTPDDTRQVLDYWKNTVDCAGVELDLETQLVRRRLDMTRKPNGMVAGKFLMTDLAAAGLETAIDALMPPPAENDLRTASQRRHDALEDLAYNFLENTNTRTSGGERPHVNVHVDVDALKGEPGGLHETTDGHVLPIQNIRQISCDSSLCRIVFGPSSEILDLGRKTRIISAGLRRALVARDRHCQHSGCRRPARWCDAHHEIHWADGGETKLENLVLLCRYHHTLAHRHDSVEDELFDQPCHLEAPTTTGNRPT
jgi:hypothetical protein